MHLFPSVMPGFVPGFHVVPPEDAVNTLHSHVDGRDKPGHDE